MESKTLTPPSIPVVFENKTGRPDSKIWVQFLNGNFGARQYGANGTVKLSGDTAYSFEKLKSKMPAFPALKTVPNVSLNDFTNGRIYFNYGDKGLQGLGNGYQPSPNNVNDPNYKKQYAFVEPNFFGNQNNNMDLSAIDFFSIPIEASTWKHGKMVKKLNCKNGAAIGDTIEYLINLSHSKAAVYDHHSFVRVIGPGLAEGYRNWDAYLKYLSSFIKPTKIKGLFSGLPGGTGPTAQQTYNLSATFNDKTKQVILTGKCAVEGDVTISIKFDALNALTGIYGANPPYTVTAGSKQPYTTAGIVNDVFGWIVGDLLAGLNMGFPGSTTINPINNIPLGQCTSSEWFQAAIQHPSLLFAGAQPKNKDYYNDWAATLLPVTNAYGFPFSDRVGGLLLYFPPEGSVGAVDYLKITLLDVGFPA
jgi:Beta-1,3-glucanase